MKGIAASFLLTMMLLMPATADATCRQALSIGLDISGSVDDSEYRLQMDGLARALTYPEVQAAFLSMPDVPVYLYVFEWAGPSSQAEILPWTPINTASDLATVSKHLLSVPRQPREVATALGTAMVFGAKSLAAVPQCWRHTLDLTGDGDSNVGPRPRDVRKQPIFANITINALVIGADAAPFTDARDSEVEKLRAYFTEEVIKGPDAFVEAATDFKTFEEAMARKLLKELQAITIGQAEIEATRFQ